jgi:uncharacterized protein (TIGR02145 family)
MKAIKVVLNLFSPNRRHASVEKRSYCAARYAGLMFAVISCAAIYSAVQAQITYEAEKLVRASSAGTTTELIVHTDFSDGQSVRLNSTTIGNWVEWTIPNVAAGTYTVAFYFKKQNDHGIVQASIDGVNQGTPTDMYSSTNVYRMPAAIGSKTFATSGNKVIRLAVTGKFSASTGYSMLIDFFMLTPASSPLVRLVDIDGNTYKTVKIGHQEWTQENLRVTRLNDGTPIPNVTDNAIWVGLSTPGYCWYNNELGNKRPYGALYNGYAVNTGKLAPVGWRVPTDADWTELENYLIANRYNYDFTTIDNKIATSMASKSHWATEFPDKYMVNGMIGYNLTRNNSSRFSALPGGQRNYNGYFDGQSYGGIWWSATETEACCACYRSLYYDHSDMFGYGTGFSKVSGFSVRLVRDSN